MWKHLLSGGLKVEQQNASAKKLILSVLNSTATKREARDYLTKYTRSDDSKQLNHCLLLIRHLNSLRQHEISELTSTVKKLGMLGLRPIFVIPPSRHIAKQAEILDIITTLAGFRPLQLQNSLSQSIDGTYTSILSSQNAILNNHELEVVPILKPYVYREKDASEFLTNDFTKFMQNLCKGNNTHIDKFFILNRIGGIPSNERNENSHVFVNLSQEYDCLKKDLKGQVDLLIERRPRTESLLHKLELHLNEDAINTLENQFKEHLQDLEMMNVVLSNLSSSATGLITTIESAASSSEKKNPLIYNILTDRSLISSSLPRFKKIRHTPPSGSRPAKKFHRMTYLEDYQQLDKSSPPDSALVTTVFKKGIDIKIFDYPKLTQFNSLSLPVEFRVKDSPQTNPLHKIDLSKLKGLIDRSFKRSLNLNHYLHRINGNIASIIVIGDYDGIAILTNEGPNDNPFVYLDKFAISPEMKGSLCISDIIFNLMVKKFPKELLWRSRNDNVVNKWYFQRSVGVLDLSIDLGDGNQTKSNFNLFYYGEPKSTNYGFHNLARLKEYAKHIRDIHPSWDK
ncbi:hypothetical protein Kpol_1027p10 [Vanderwaltozyma polyspora DSM 70294]|uniref:Amino-acid acetyltransferase, mitochondrial n=1 Tax=Vanderwaltozyma polyspora (strain ATCC 22028 / DSM 70294 / BCRC 21397 / CBS 2163 / NBRC 10782 / NRRL Y-8283 / UCD 57-17) TaxID=436907 RepID=NAGS_VANPO|nr:uncharacterized protein Kpol_1027p10 [Vanderwaltozyma polyspora DSM 70294]A7TQL5.1 RecName: Full=Amino-acid acetyltransferase, mitochondrial; AltName: Full=Arginine-requiring protein 2; AltName: Full=Glutamate N-acetyltransferase; AltName: Full=N-acetylglutamate synthase; Short=AGS; Short=NAGS; Flags: Precursor [Vanderwaltozyma polyspora DSM 70294]EDO15436.1 hypothetical protein Kpol_1027p10 [Vanderwaltozyma polyspora DSM 70294]